MKKYFFLLTAIFLVFSLQRAFSLTSPIDFREFATDNSGNLQLSTTLYEVNIRILNGSTTIYEETFSSVTTDEFGIFRVQVGTGTVVTGDYSTITPTYNHWINCRIKITAASTYKTVSQVKLLNAVYRNAVGVGISVETGEITDGTIIDADISPTAGIQVSKLAGGTAGDFLVTDSTGTPVWSAFPPSGAINTQPPIIGDGTGADPVTLYYNTTYFDLDGSKLIIADNAITTGKIANGAVTNAKIDNNAVTTNKIQPGSNNQFLVTDNAGNTNWVSFNKSSKFTGNGVGTALDIAAGAITTNEIANGTILPADIDLSQNFNFTGNLQQGGNNVLTTATSFSASGGSDATVSGNYNTLNIQLGTGVVGGNELEDLIPNPSGTYGNATTVPVITVDVNGRVTGVTTTSINFPAETDPEVNMTTTNAVPRWNGSALVDGSMTDNGTVVTVTVDANFQGDVNIGSSSSTNSVTIQNDGSTVPLNVMVPSGATIPAVEITDGTNYIDIDPAGGNLVIYSGTNSTSLWSNGDVKLTNNIIFDQVLLTGTLQSATITPPGKIWTLPDASGTIITTGNLTQITAVGTVASGTWNGSVIGEIYGGTGQSSYATGDLLYASAANTLSKLTIGSAGQVLAVSGGVPAWTTLSTLETDPVWTAAISGAQTITGNWTFNNPITGSITGNAGTATALQTARNFSISGDATGGPVSFNGTADVNIAVTIANNAVTSAKILNGTIVPADVDLTAAGWNFTTLQQGGFNVLTTNTTFSGDVSGLYNNLQLGTGVVGGNELEDLIPNPSGTYGNATTVPVITVDVNGRVTGVTTTSINFPAETDPEVNMTTTNAVPRWNGSALVNGSMTDNGTVVTVTVDANFQGDVTIGDDASDALIVNATSTFSAPATISVPAATSSGASLEIYNNRSGSAVPVVQIFTNANLDNYLLNVDATGSTVTGAAQFLAKESGTRPNVYMENEGTAPALYLTNSGGGTALYIENYSSTTPGLAIEVSDGDGTSIGGGAVKLSYGSASPSSNYTIPDGFSVYVINNGSNAITVTLPTGGTNGQMLYVIVTGTANVTFNSVMPNGGNKTTSGAAHLQFVYANGGWKLVSEVE